MPNPLTVEKLSVWLESGNEAETGFADFENDSSSKDNPPAGMVRVSAMNSDLRLRKSDGSEYGWTYATKYVPTPSAPNIGLVAGSQNFGEDDDLSEWVEFDGGSKIAASVENGCLVITKEGDAGTQFRGFGKDFLPSGDFTLICEMSAQRHNSGGGGQKFQFALFEDIGDVSKKSAGLGYYVDLGAGQNATVTADAFDNSTAGGTIFGTQNVTLGGGLFTQLLRIKKVGTNFKFYCSSTGREWQVIFDGTLSFTPTGFGWWMSAAADVTCIVPWIYIYDDAPPTQVFGNTLAIRTGA